MRLFRRTRIPNPAPPPKRDPREATEAKVRAQRELERTRAQTPLYRNLGNRWRELREQNHFAEAIAASFRGDVS